MQVIAVALDLTQIIAVFVNVCQDKMEQQAQETQVCLFFLLEFELDFQKLWDIYWLRKEDIFPNWGQSTHLVSPQIILGISTSSKYFLSWTFWIWA